MKMRTVEYYRLWADNGDTGTWDTAFIDIPYDTPIADFNKAIRCAVAQMQWRANNPPTVVGLYSVFGDTKARPDDWCCRTQSGKHEPDWASVTPAANGKTSGVLYINCKRCGRSGSFVCDPEDINW